MCRCDPCTDAVLADRAAYYVANHPSAKRRAALLAEHLREHPRHVIEELDRGHWRCAGSDTERCQAHSPLPRGNTR